LISVRIRDRAFTVLGTGVDPLFPTFPANRSEQHLYGGSRLATGDQIAEGREPRLMLRPLK